MLHACRTPWVLACAPAWALLCAAWVAGCGSSSSGGAPSPSLSGVVLDYTDAPARDVPLAVLGRNATTTRLDGLFVLGPLPDGPAVLRVGDSVTTPTLLVPFTLAGDTGLPRPVHLPDLASGLEASLPAAITTPLIVQGDALPGVSLTLPASTAVTLPPGAPALLRVLGISPSRLPTPLPGDLFPAVALAVEPHAATFTPAATLRLPRLDPLAAGPFDAYRVDTTTGEWTLTQSDVPLDPSGETFLVEVTRGTLVCVVPRTPPTTVTVRGRLVVGTQPLEGFRVSCWNRASTPTLADGRFEIPDVPDGTPTLLLRIYPARPGANFAPDVFRLIRSQPDVGDLSVAARPPDNLEPRVRATSPDADAVNVNPRSQITVTFSEPIDRSIGAPFRLIGLNGEVQGRHNYDNDFQARFIPAQPLDPDEEFVIQVDSNVRDLTGNPLDDDTLLARFRTRSGAPDPPPTDTLAFGIDPLRAQRGDTVSIVGRNFTGGTQVSFGGTQGLVLSEASDEIRARVPSFVPAGDVTLSLSAGGSSLSVLRPLVLDLRAGIATILSGNTPGEPLTILDLNDPPTAVVVDGDNLGGAALFSDGVGIAAVDSLVAIGGNQVAAGRTLNGTSQLLLTGPVVARGANGNPSVSYRFLMVRR